MYPEKWKRGYASWDSGLGNRVSLTVMGNTEEGAGRMARMTCVVI